MNFLPLELLDSEEERDAKAGADWQQGGMKCKRCGTGGLHWEETEKGWRLFSDLGMHSCTRAATYSK